MRLVSAASVRWPITTQWHAADDNIMHKSWQNYDLYIANEMKKSINCKSLKRKKYWFENLESLIIIYHKIYNFFPGSDFELVAVTSIPPRLKNARRYFLLHKQIRKFQATK